MRLIATDDPVAWCVSLSRGCAVQKWLKIEVLFEVETLEDPTIFISVLYPFC